MNECQICNQRFPTMDEAVDHLEDAHRVYTTVTNKYLEELA